VLIDWNVDIDLLDTIVTVHKGATVTWAWQGDVPLNVVSGAGRVANGMFTSGEPTVTQRFSYVFDVPGRYPYFDLLHSWMGGVVVVVDPVTVDSGVTADVVVDWTFDPSPGNLVISIGDTVKWQWTSPDTHNVVSGSRGAANAGLLFSSGAASNEGSLTVTFNEVSTRPGPP